MSYEIRWIRFGKAEELIGSYAVTKPDGSKIGMHAARQSLYYACTDGAVRMRFLGRELPGGVEKRFLAFIGSGEPIIPLGVELYYLDIQHIFFDRPEPVPPSLPGTPWTFEELVELRAANEAVAAPSLAKVQKVSRQVSKTALKKWLDTFAKDLRGAEPPSQKAIWDQAQQSFPGKRLTRRQVVELIQSDPRLFRDKIGRSTKPQK